MDLRSLENGYTTRYSWENANRSAVGFGDCNASNTAECSVVTVPTIRDYYRETSMPRIQEVYTLILEYTCSSGCMLVGTIMVKPL